MEYTLPAEDAACYIIEPIDGGFFFLYPNGYAYLDWEHRHTILRWCTDSVDINYPMVSQFVNGWHEIELKPDPPIWIIEHEEWNPDGSVFWESCFWFDGVHVLKRTLDNHKDTRVTKFMGLYSDERMMLENPPWLENA